MATSRLPDYKRKVVLLDFWGNLVRTVWTGNPRRRSVATGVSALGIAGSRIPDGCSVQPVRDFYRQFQLNYPLPMVDAGTAKLYGGVYGLPVNFVIGRDGHTAQRYAG